DTAYMLKCMSTTFCAQDIAVVRINSDVLAWRRTTTGMRRSKLPSAPGGRWVGLLLAFSTRTAEPLLLMPDGALQRLRVGATSAIAARWMARAEAGEVALLGSGWQAGGQLLALACVRNLERVRCFSPTPSKRDDFCARMQARLGIPVEPHARARDAVRGADVVLCATNSVTPVMRAEWLEPGMHIGSIREGELEPELLARADRVVIHDRANMRADRIHVTHGLRTPDQHSVAQANPALHALLDAPTLTELVAGRVAGRESERECNVFLNHHGMALQFAAVASVILERAHAAGVGRELPGEWFTQDRHS
ncbi:MAG: ornithine cyclodeaminase family protein, partial [Gammaproteobacteria bacterium]|nr:ornithine cyclodeaminase family protein [Gammaproteobacteria bacterium]